MSEVLGSIGAMMEAAKWAYELCEETDGDVIEILVERDGFVIRGMKSNGKLTLHAVTWRQFADQPKLLMAGVSFTAGKLRIG